jgi:hypothetical protein
MAFYTMDFRTTPATHHAGDGFFPPFARIGDRYVFSPELVLSYTHLRNAVFAFAAEQRGIAEAGGDDLFSNFVSAELELVLVGQAVELLCNSHPWITCTGIHYKGGEIDLVVAGPDGPVLLVQAKGVLPPQGARLTRNLSTRIREGIRQVGTFRKLPSAEQERIVSKAVGRPVAHADIRHGLLARACFGLPEAYDPKLGISLMTLPLLSLALGVMRDHGQSPDVDVLLSGVQTELRRVLNEADCRWEEGRMQLAGRVIRMPLLRFDDSVDANRRLAWERSLIMDPNPATRRRS